MNDTTAVPANKLSTKAMWLLALVLAIGLLSLAVAALPGRAKPLFLLPLAFGIGAAGMSVGLSRSLDLKSVLGMWLITTALALGGYGQVVSSAYRQFEAANAAQLEADQKAIVAIQMLKDTEHSDLAKQMQVDLDARRNTWERFLSRRYSAFGDVTGRVGEWALVLEAVLVVAGVAAGRRLLDGMRSVRQA